MPRLRQLRPTPSRRSPLTTQTAIPHRPHSRIDGERHRESAADAHRTSSGPAEDPAGRPLGRGKPAIVSRRTCRAGQSLRDSRQVDRGSDAATQPASGEAGSPAPRSPRRHPPTLPEGPAQPGPLESADADRWHNHRRETESAADRPAGARVSDRRASDRRVNAPRDGRHGGDGRRACARDHQRHAVHRAPGTRWFRAMRQVPSSGRFWSVGYALRSSNVTATRTSDASPTYFLSIRPGFGEPDRNFFATGSQLRLQYSLTHNRATRTGRISRLFSRLSRNAYRIQTL